MTQVPKPLEGIRVLDFAQFLAGPYAALRLADLGADVIKVERPQGGDLCRQLVVADAHFDGDSLLFHTINRNKRSFAADLKKPDDLAAVKDLIKTADVMLHNFRPGVMDRIGLDYETAKRINPKIVYGEITGYGSTGPLTRKPGQDLLVQALTGLAWLSGNADQGPTPPAFAILDLTCGNHLVQGLLAALVRRATTGEGALVEVDLTSSALDLQFEQLTVFFNGQAFQPQRSRIGHASVHAGAPYGVYETAEGYLAIAMAPIAQLAELLGCDGLLPYVDPDVAYAKRDEIKTILAEFLKTGTTAQWLAVLEPADVWCAEVLDWPKMAEHEGFQAVDPLQDVVGANGEVMRTTRCPIRIDGETLKSEKGAPRVGQHNAELTLE